METYNETTSGTTGGWISCRRNGIRPTEGEAVVLAGRFLPGLLVYRIGFWIDEEKCWDVQDVVGDPGPFEPLYWKSIGAAPRGFMDEA